MSIQSESALSQAYNLIENGSPAQAKVLLEDALTADLDNDNLVFAIHCCSFWADTFASLAGYSPYEGGELLTGFELQGFEFNLHDDHRFLPLDGRSYTLVAAARWNCAYRPGSPPGSCGPAVP